MKFKSGTISKVLGINKDSQFDLICEGFILSSAWVVNHSKNIIDLIEVGDYVNGEKVYMGEEYGEPCLMIPAIPVEFCGIESIVTKEQFASMEYKLKED